MGRVGVYFRCALGIGIAALVMLLLAGGAGAATIMVDDSGGGDYTRIQDVIDWWCFEKL